MLIQVLKTKVPVHAHVPFGTVHVCTQYMYVQLKALVPVPVKPTILENSCHTLFPNEIPFHFTSCENPCTEWENFSSIFHKWELFLHVWYYAHRLRI